jgi:ufm1-conjugating enzyme 1
MHKYEFQVQFDLPITYPVTPFEIILPELEDKTVKMYRGGKICLSAHFKPLWQRNVPHFGIAHALACGLGPYIQAEIKHLVESGQIDETDSYRFDK